MAANSESILDSIKDALGLAPEYTVFDMAITMHINAAIGSLLQHGVGADTGFIVQDNTTIWSQYVSSLGYLNLVKQYIYTAVRLAYDPPQSGYGITALQEMLKELGWRIVVAVEKENPPADPFAVTDEDTLTGTLKTYFAPKTVHLDYLPVVTPDASQGNVFTLVMTGNCTINPPVNGAEGQHITMQITSNGHTVTWGLGWNFGDAGVPQLSSGTDVIAAYFEPVFGEWLAGFTSGF
jgi:hypothetical protein